jgi:hypothetical protein
MDMMGDDDEELGGAPKGDERDDKGEAARSARPASRDPDGRVRTDARTAIDSATAGEEFVDDTPRPSVDGSGRSGQE